MWSARACAAERKGRHVRMEPYCGSAVFRSFIVWSHVLWFIIGSWHQTDLVKDSPSEGLFLLLAGNAWTMLDSRPSISPWTTEIQTSASSATKHQRRWITCCLGAASPRRSGIFHLCDYIYRFKFQWRSYQSYSGGWTRGSYSPRRWDATLISSSSWWDGRFGKRGIECKDLQGCGFKRGCCGWHCPG